MRFILPLGPGSGVDIGSRLIADRLSQKWGKPVVIENKPGGDAIVAITAFTGANDDHTFLMAPTSTFTAHPFLHEKLPYDVKDLVPIARVSNTIVAVGVPASLGINSLDELIARAKAEPGKLNSAGTTGAIDFVVAGFSRRPAPRSPRCRIATACRRSTISPKAASSSMSRRSRSCGRRCRPERSRSSR